MMLNESIRINCSLGESERLSVSRARRMASHNLTPVFVSVGNGPMCLVILCRFTFSAQKGLFMFVSLLGSECVQVI